MGEIYPQREAGADRNRHLASGARSRRKRTMSAPSPPRAGVAEAKACTWRETGDRASIWLATSSNTGPVEPRVQTPAADDQHGSPAARHRLLDETPQSLPGGVRAQAVQVAARLGQELAARQVAQGFVGNSEPRAGELAVSSLHHQLRRPGRRRRPGGARPPLPRHSSPGRYPARPGWQGPHPGQLAFEKEALIFGQCGGRWRAGAMNRAPTSVGVTAGGMTGARPRTAKASAMAGL